MVPGDPARRIAGPRADPVVLATVRANLHLDDPVTMQLVDYVEAVGQGDLGLSYIRRRARLDMIFGACCPRRCCWPGGAGDRDRARQRARAVGRPAQTPAQRRSRRSTSCCSRSPPTRSASCCSTSSASSWAAAAVGRPRAEGAGAARASRSACSACRTTRASWPSRSAWRRRRRTPRTAIAKGLPPPGRARPPAAQLPVARDHAGRPRLRDLPLGRRVRRDGVRVAGHRRAGSRSASDSSTGRC